MPLSSQLFRGDPALEAAANDDSAHIIQGARGPHVVKIQTALNTLDDANLDADGVYGPATANAMLRYKTKRNIVNRSRQTSADNIVGKMTIASLDEEMKAHETKPSPTPPPKPKPKPRPPGPPLVLLKANVFVGNMGRAEKRSHLVLEYYKFCGIETIGETRIETAAVSRFNTFEALIDALIASNHSHNIVVNHGDAGNGLLIRFCAETQFRATGLIIGALQELADRRQRGPLNFNDADTKLFTRVVRTQARVSRDVVVRIVNKLVKLRGKPRIIHLRACNQKTDFMARRYMNAFGAIRLSFHGPRLIYQKLDPLIPRDGSTVSQIDKRISSDAERRFRLFEDSLGEIATMLVGLVVKLDLQGDVIVEESVQLIDRRTSADLDGWAQAIISRWNTSTQKGFIVPIMWDDDDPSLSFALPLESAWRNALQFV
jgi:hypothetical protein